HMVDRISRSSISPAETTIITAMTAHGNTWTPEPFRVSGICLSFVFMNPPDIVRAGFTANRRQHHPGRFNDGHEGDQGRNRLQPSGMLLYGPKEKQEQGNE